MMKIQTGKAEIIRLVKFGSVGVLNTALTFFLFWGLRSIGVGLNTSNVLSYIGGGINSFVCNKLWVFKAQGSAWIKEALLFALGLGICWAIQWVVFILALAYCPELAAQAIGMVVYTMCNYLYNRLITFHTAPH